MIQWWSAVGLVGCYWSTGEDKAAEDALMGLQETGEGGGRGGARGRRRQGKRRREGSEEMGIIKKLLSVLPLQSGVVFILKHSYCSCTHTHTPPVPQFAQNCILPSRPPKCSGGQGTGREKGCLSRCCCNSAAVPVMTSRSV